MPPPVSLLIYCTMSPCVCAPAARSDDFGSTEMLFSFLSKAFAAELKRQLPYNHLEGKKADVLAPPGRNWPHQPG